MSKQYEKEFKENAVQYHHDHPELTIKQCAEKLGVPYDTYHGWLNSAKTKGKNAFRGSGNYSSDEAKEIARLKRRISVSRVLSKLGVSVSGYKAWKKRKPSDTELRRNRIKEDIIDIYNGSYQNYGAPKITRELRKRGEVIAERTVGKYMRQIGIKAQWVKPYVKTTINPDFNSTLKNILDEQFNPECPNAVWCSDITYIWTDA